MFSTHMLKRKVHISYNGENKGVVRVDRKRVFFRSKSTKRFPTENLRSEDRLGFRKKTKTNDLHTGYQP